MAERFKVTYLARSGNEDDAEVSVNLYPDMEGATPAYYATNLRLWGCGKNAPTQEGAIRALVQDMATILHIEKI